MRVEIDLNAKPIRKIDWIDVDGVVKLKVIKFKGKMGQWICRLLKRPNYFLVNLDEVGTFIWKKCNGKNSVKDILDELEKKYGKEMMRERLFFFLLSLKRQGYLEFLE